MSAMVASGKPGAGWEEAGTAVVCCTEAAGEAYELMPVGVDVAARVPDVAPDVDTVRFEPDPATALIAYMENPVLVAAKVTCPSDVLTTVVGKATHVEPE